MLANSLLKYNFKSCLDVGANTGQFAQEILSQQNIRIVSIEPNPYCISKLKKLNIECIHGALGNKNSKLELLIPADKRMSKGSSFFLQQDKTGIDDITKVEVDVFVGDELFKNDIFDLIKIDTQGYEFFVIDGAKQLISRARYILIEFQTILTNKGAPESINSVKLLETLGFKICDLININNGSYVSKFGSTHLDILFEKRESHNLECLNDFKEYFKGIK
jgi:FkbM family methyltransferase